MSISIRQYVDNGTSGDVNPISVTLSSAVVGDTVVAIFIDNFFTFADINTPAGTAVTTWAFQSTASVDGGTNDNHIKVWTGVVTTAGGTVSVAQTDNGDERALLCWVLSTTPVSFDSGAGTDADTTSTSAVAPSVTPTTGQTDDLLICVWGTPSGGVINFTVPGSMNPRTEWDLGGQATYRGAEEQLTVDTATGTRTATVSAAREWIATSVLIKSAGGGATPAPLVPTQMWPQNMGPWPRPQVVLGDVFVPPGTSALADVAAATGTAFFDATGGSISINLIADSPIDVVGTAYNATVSTAQHTNAAAGLASATGTANSATSQVAPGPTAATATGTANNATISTAVSVAAGLASGTGTANGATVKVAPGPTAATATGTANTTTSQVATGPTAATATGAANNATISTGSATSAPAGLASATGTANNTTSQVAPDPTVATAAGVANSATISTGSATSAPAGLASVTGTANNTTSLVATGPPVASATGVANSATSQIATGPSAATATGTAGTTTSKVSPTSDFGAGTGVAHNATVQTGSFTNVAAGLATGTGTANNATGKVATGPAAATATGTANNATVSVGGSTNAAAGLASATGVANNPTVTRGVFPAAGVATGTGVAFAAHLSVLASAEAAVALAAALSPAAGAFLPGTAHAATGTAPSASAGAMGVPTASGG